MLNITDLQQEAQRQGVSLHVVLKEKVQKILLYGMFEQGFFPSLVFQGGTALRLFYGGTRYSEDLDFVLAKPDKDFLSKLPEKLKGLKNPVEKFLPLGAEVQLRVQKKTSTFHCYVLSIRLEGLPAKDKTPIEIANVPSYDPQIKMIQDADLGLSPAVSVESPQEILSDKICAFGDRKYVKGRDLWDIFFLKTTLRVGVNEAVRSMVLKKIQDYGSEEQVFRHKFKERLADLQKDGTPILKAEMDKFLPRVYRNLYEPQYGTIVREVGELLVAFHESQASR